MNLISTSDPSTSVLPTAEWIEACGEEGLELPLLTSAETGARFVRVSLLQSGEDVMEPGARGKRSLMLNEPNEDGENTTVMSGINKEPKVGWRGRSRRHSM